MNHKNKADMWQEISRLLSMLANVTQRGYEVVFRIRVGGNSENVLFHVLKDDVQVYPDIRCTKGVTVDRILHFSDFADFKQGIDAELLALNEFFFPNLVQIQLSKKEVQNES
jgi:hypothetical protein